MADFETLDVVRMGCKMKWDNLYDIVNVYHFIIDGGGPLTAAQMGVGIAAYADAIYGFLTALMPNNLTPDEISVANVTQGTVFGAQAWGVWAGGTATGDAMPLGCAVLTWGRTFKSRVQLRKYYGPFEEAQSTDGVWSATVRSACVAAMSYHIAQQTPSVGITITGVAYNRTLGTITYGQGATAATEVAYQRRRKRGVGS